MLNELYSLSRVLESKNISATEWHREYKLIPKVTYKAPCIRIWLAKDGTICGIESISAELALSLRKFGNNQGTFPAFNIVPLYRITDERQIEELENIKKRNSIIDLNNVRSWCINDNWNENIIKKVERCLHSTSHELLELIRSSDQTEDAAIILELIRVAEAFPYEQEKSFRAKLEEFIFNQLQKQDHVAMFLSLLFYISNPQKTGKNDTGPSLSIILDLFDWKQYNYPVASEHTTEWINKKLLLSVKSGSSAYSETNLKDAFGLPFINLGKPMPSVKLSGFEVILRSMFNGQPCQYRYKRIDDASYPISYENRSLVKKSLEWIADINREGITWQKIDKSEIVFVYPSKLPEVPLKFASIFGPNQTDQSARSEARFEQISNEFIKTLKGIPFQDKPEIIQIFTIRKLGKGRSKVIFTRNCSSDQLIQAAEDWENGCNNAPSIDLGDKITPFPLHVARIVNNTWKQSGELAQGKHSVVRMKSYQGMELLLDVMQETMLRNFLHILLTNSSGLVSYIGNWVHAGSKFKDKSEEKRLTYLKNEAIQLSSVLALLLFKHHDRKEIYMESTAYLIGQLLKISDELHTLYCNAVRNEGVPPQLAGSSLFVSACETPNQAVSQLAIRMNPYITWAKQYRFKNIRENGKESWKSGWYLSLYEEVANKLHIAMSNATRFNDFEKAQLFIGYLASFPKREPSATCVTNDNNNYNVTGGSEIEQ